MVFPSPSLIPIPIIPIFPIPGQRAASRLPDHQPGARQALARREGGAQRLGGREEGAGDHAGPGGCHQGRG